MTPIRFRQAYIYISTPSTRKGSHAESKASHGQKEPFFSNVLNSFVFYYTWFRKPNFCVQTMSEQYLADCFFFSFPQGEHAQKPKFGESEKTNFIRHFARFNFSPLSIAFILKYYPILHVVKR